MQVFILHCERRYNASLSLPCGVFGSLLAAKGRLSNFQKLYLNASSDNIIDLFEYVPQLHSIHLRSSLTSSMIKAPWTQLQYCEISSREADDCLEL
jgi:hypothetical protein